MNKQEAMEFLEDIICPAPIGYWDENVEWVPYEGGDMPKHIQSETIRKMEEDMVKTLETGDSSYVTGSVDGDKHIASSHQVGGDHYRKMTIQPARFVHVNKIGFLEGLAIKYICRHESKDGEIDIDKAIHCLNLLKEWEYSYVPEHGGSIKQNGRG
jgi:hypothetical protein